SPSSTRKRSSREKSRTGGVAMLITVLRLVGWNFGDGGRGAGTGGRPSRRRASSSRRGPERRAAALAHGGDALGDVRTGQAAEELLMLRVGRVGGRHRGSRP